MKNNPRFFLPILFLLSAMAFGQDLSSIDTRIDAYPKTFSSAEKLAERIGADFTSDTEKSRAIYAWIAKNVSYDIVEFRANSGGKVAFKYRTEEEKRQKLNAYNMELVAKTLRTKKGVCRGYAALFDRVATLAGLETQTIPGASKSHPTHIGKMPASDHIWNAVKINGDWKLLDVTWGSGAINSQGKFVAKYNPGYFFTDPALFFLNHYPEDRKWLPDNRNAQDFAKLPLFYGSYFLSGYTVSFPKSGVLPKGYIVPFKIENLHTDQIAYVFSKDNQFREVASVKNGNVTEFEIPIDKRAGGYLTLYLGRDSVVTYKLGDAATN